MLSWSKWANTDEKRLQDLKLDLADLLITKSYRILNLGLLNPYKQHNFNGSSEWLDIPDLTDFLRDYFPGETYLKT